MPIQLLDNFDLGTTKPLDNRIVVGPSSFYQTREQITHKYAGLRVWDLNLNLPFVWTGVTWSNENSGTVIVTGGVGGYIPKFTGGFGSNVQTISQIYESVSGFNTFIGIGTTSPVTKFQVVGTITGTLFSGDGAQLTNLSATNVATGTLSLNRLQNGALNSILVADSIPTWKSSTTFRIGSSSGLVISNESSSSNTFDLLFSRTSDVYPDSLSPNSYYVKSSQSGLNRILFRPSSGALLMGDGSAFNPVFSFSSSGSTGIYKPPGLPALAISVAGNQVFLINSSSLTIGQSAVGSAYIRTSSTGFTTPTYTFWGSDQFGMFRSTQGIGFAGGDPTATSRHIMDLYAGISSAANSLRIYSPNLTTGFLEIQRWTTGNVNGWTRFVSSTATVVDFIASVSGVDTPLTSFNVTAGISALVGRVGIGTYTPSSSHKLHCVADSSNGSVLFATNIWTSAGHNSTIYIGDQNHYIRATYGGANGLSLASFDNIKFLTGTPHTERLQIASNGVISTSNLSQVRLGDITGFQQGFLNVSTSIGIEGDWLSINSTYTTGFQSARSFPVGGYSQGPNGFYIKVQDNSGTGAGTYRVTFNTSYGMTPGQATNQFNLKTDTSLYNHRQTFTARPVYINQYGDLQSGPAQVVTTGPSGTATVNDSAFAWFFVSGTTQVNMPSAASSFGQVYTLINTLGSGLNISPSFKGSNGSGGIITVASIPSGTPITLISNGVDWYRIQ